MKTPHIYRSGLIGNCSYMAHVDTTGNIRWMCWPQFDSDFVFGSMLDQNKGGHFFIRPAEADFHTRQYYLRNTNIICTEFESASGSFRVYDFAPRFFQYERIFRPVMLMRKIELVNGRPQVKVCCQPRQKYGAEKLACHDRSNHLTFEGREEPIRLYSDLPLAYIREGDEFTVARDYNLILTWGITVEDDVPTLVQSYFTRTLQYWLNWVSNNHIGTFHQKAMIRSALVLKIHQFEDTGAIVASSTTSLPESPGSGRNWDYRYCWIRDTYYTLAALSSLGSFSELQKYDEYIHSLYRPDNMRFQPLYPIAPRGVLTEREVDLEGYLGNKPVRVGNQAHEHIQNDAYGQVLVSLLPLYVDARFPKRYAQLPMRKTVREILDEIALLMDEPDAGLWEFRNLSQHHAYTYLFHWAGAKAAEKIGKYHKDQALVTQSRQVQASATAWLDKCFDKERGVYTQAAETKNLDASLLQLITMRYLDPRSEKAQQHLRVLESELRTPEGLFYRYRHKDDFGTPETTFLVCSFWYAEALACVGRIDEAIEIFEHLLAYGNHLGLLPEDISAKDGSQWGNFPQTYSHVGLLNAAFRISNYLDRPLYY